MEGGAECSAGGMKGCSGSWVVLGVGWLDPLSFLFLLLVFYFCFSFLCFFFSERNIHEITSERASKRLYCAALHYTTPSSSYTITSPPPVLASSRRSIDLVHQRRPPAPTPCLPSPLLLEERWDGGRGGLLFTIVTFRAMLFVWQEFLRWCVGHSFGKLGGGADGRGEEVFFS